MLSKATIGIKELQNFNISHYDIIDIEDKRTKEAKGVFIANKYALLVKEYLEKIDNQRVKKIESKFESICGFGSIICIDKYRFHILLSIALLISVSPILLIS